MSNIYIYPNNDVEIDGQPVKWGKKEFDRYGINLIRIRKLIVHGGQAEVRTHGAVKLTIFPTKEVVECDVRANADRAAMPERLKRALPKRGRTSKRKVEMREGVLHLECMGTNGCQDVKPADQFYNAKKMKHGKMGQCKKCWDRYLDHRKKINASKS